MRTLQVAIQIADNVPGWPAAIHIYRYRPDQSLQCIQAIHCHAQEGRFPLKLALVLIREVRKLHEDTNQRSAG